jgi:hypothetical protein
LLRSANPERVQFEPAVLELLPPLLEVDWLAGERDIAVDFKPPLLVAGTKFAHPPAPSIHERALLLERLVDLNKPVVEWLAFHDLHFYDAEALINGIKESAVALLTLAKSLFAWLPLRHIAYHLGKPKELSTGVLESNRRTLDKQAAAVLPLQKAGVGRPPVPDGFRLSCSGIPAARSSTVYIEAPG